MEGPVQRKRPKIAPSRPPSKTNGVQGVGGAASDGGVTNAEETVAFHGVLYQMKINSRKWESLSKGFATLRIRRDLSTGRKSRCMLEAQEGSSKLLCVPTSSNVKVKCKDSFVQWTCKPGDALMPVAYGCRFSTQQTAVEFESKLSLAIHNGESELLCCLAESDASLHQNVVSQPNDLFIKVHLPGKQTTTVAVSPNMSVHDFLLYVCERRHLNSAWHGLTLPPDSPGKSSRQFDGLTKIGSLRTHEIHLVHLPSIRNVGERVTVKTRGTQLKPMQGQQLILQVHLPCVKEKTTVSVSPTMLVRDLLAVVCEKRGFNPSLSALEFVHSQNGKSAIDLHRCIGDLKVNEIKLVVNGGETARPHVAAPSQPGAVLKKAKQHPKPRSQEGVAVTLRQQTSSKATTRPLSSRGYGHITLDINVLAPEWEQFFAMANFKLEASDLVSLKTLNNLVMEFGGLERVLLSETVRLSLFQSSEFLSLQKSDKAVLPLSIPLQSKHPRKKAPLPPISANVSKVHPAGSVFSDSTTMDSKKEDLSSHITSVHAGTQLPKRLKQKAPPPPLYRDQHAHQSDQNTSNTLLLDEEGTGIDAVQLSALTCVDEIKNDHLAVGGSKSQKNLEVELDEMGNTEIKECLVPGVSVNGHTVATGSIISSHNEMTRDSTVGVDEFLDLPLPPPPEDVSMLYVRGDDLPPPPIDAIEESTCEQGDDLPLPSEMYDSKCSVSLLNQDDDGTAQTMHQLPPGKQLKSRDSVHSSFEVEMDELSSLLDSVVAEAEAYFTSSNDRSSEGKLISQKKSKAPPPLPKKPKISPSSVLLKPQDLLRKKVPGRETVKTIASSSNSASSMKNCLPPPMPVPYAESPAAKRRVNRTPDNLVASSQHVTCNSKPTAQVTKQSPVVGRWLSSEASIPTTGSYNLKGSVTPSPCRSQHLPGFMNSSDHRARSSTLPSSTKVVSGNTSLSSPSALRSLVLSSATGTVRGIRGQVKQRVSSFPDVPNAVSDSGKKHFEDSCFGSVDKTIRDFHTENVNNQSLMNAVTGTVDKGTVSYCVDDEQEGNSVSVQSQSADLYVSSVGRTHADRIVLNFPPPPCESPPLSPTLPSYIPTSRDNMESESQSEGRGCDFPALLPLPIAEDVIGIESTIDCDFPLVLPSPITDEALGFGDEIDHNSKLLSVERSSHFSGDGIEMSGEVSASKENMSGPLPPYPDVIDELDCELRDCVLDTLPSPPPMRVPLFESSVVTNSETVTTFESQFNFDDTGVVSISATDFPLSVESGSCSLEEQSPEVQLEYESTETSKFVANVQSSHAFPSTEIRTRNVKPVWDEGVSSDEDVTSMSMKEPVAHHDAFDDEDLSVHDQSRQLVLSCSPIVAQQAIQDNESRRVVNLANTAAQVQSEYCQSLSVPAECAESSGCLTEMMALDESQAYVPPVSGVLESSSTYHHCETLGSGAAPRQPRSTSTLASAPLVLTETGESKDKIHGEETDKFQSVGSSLLPLDYEQPVEGIIIAYNNMTDTSGESTVSSSPAQLSNTKLSSNESEKSLHTQLSVYHADSVARDHHCELSADSLMDADGTVSDIGGNNSEKLSDDVVVFSQFEQGKHVSVSGDNISVAPVLESEGNRCQEDSMIVLNFKSNDLNMSPTLEEESDCSSFPCEENSTSFPNFVRDNVKKIPIIDHSSEIATGGDSHDCVRGHVIKAARNTPTELEPRLVKAKSEDELLHSSNHRLHCRSTSSSSLSTAMVASSSARQIGKLRWNSEVDLVTLYGEYSDAYAELLTDIREGNSHANLRKVGEASRRKSIASTYTGMAAAIADAMKARRIRLTDSFKSSNRRSVVCEDQEEEDWT